MQYFTIHLRKLGQYENSFHRTTRISKCLHEITYNLQKKSAHRISISEYLYNNIDQSFDAHKLTSIQWR